MFFKLDGMPVEHQVILSLKMHSIYLKNMCLSYRCPMVLLYRSIFFCQGKPENNSVRKTRNKFCKELCAKESGNHSQGAPFGTPCEEMWSDVFEVKITPISVVCLVVCAVRLFLCSVIVLLYSQLIGRFIH